MAGPCSVEEERLIEVARGEEASANILRARFAAPSPYAFQGLEVEG
jgi:3-deoxy-D-arabino-heptulosonate 7-phosphate (DAHP) synthase